MTFDKEFEPNLKLTKIIAAVHLMPELEPSPSWTADWRSGFGHRGIPFRAIEIPKTKIISADEILEGLDDTTRLR